MARWRPTATDAWPSSSSGAGAQVFGEKHPELLKRFSDQVFVENDGTSYALARLIHLTMDKR